MFLGVFAVLLAAATVFAAQVNSNKTYDPVYHWFDGNTYLGTGTVAEKSQICNEDTDIICMEAFESAPGGQRPSTPVVATLFELP